MKFTKRELAGDGKGLFLKFKDGDNKVGVFRGEIFEFFQKWENGKPTLVAPTDPDGKSRFRLNFVTKEETELKVKIFEFGLTVYNMLAEISEDYDLEKTAVKITRRGSGTDTVYIIIPSKEQPNATQLKNIHTLPLNILEHKEQPEKKSAPEAEHDDEVPF